MTIWHEDRLLIDGALVPASDGGHVRHRRSGDRGACSVTPPTPPSTTPGARSPRRGAPSTRRRGPPTRAFRVRCMRQLHQALLDNVEELREIIVREVGAPVSSTSGPQLEGPIEVVRWYADLLEGYDFVQDLGERDTFAGRHHRWIEQEAAGVVGAIAAYNYPIQLALGEARAGARRRVHRGAQGRARHPVGDARARPARGRGDRHPAGRAQRPRVRPTTPSVPS